jgi:hypothetical protein
MSVTPGSKISVTDMAALATLANSKSSLVNYVSPLYTDGSGNPYGYNAFSGVYIDPLNPGTDYKPGDILSLGFGSAFEVEMVSSTGGVLGIRVQNYGAGQYSDKATSPLLVTGGSGTGCRFYFSFLQFGPTASYYFPDFLPNQGVVTGFYLVSGGIGYTAGETITFMELTGLSLTVGTVDGTGKILTFSMVPSYIAVTIPQNVASMNAVGTPGTGAKFGGYFTLAQKPQWLAELNRLRNAINNLPGANGGASFLTATSPADLCVSGPWPVGSLTANFKDTWFYFDSPSAVSVTLSSGFVGESYGPFSTGVCRISQGFFVGGIWTPPAYLTELDGMVYMYYPLVASQRFAFIVGGTAPLLVQGSFFIYAASLRGGVETWTSPTTSTFVADSVSPASMVHVNTAPSGSSFAFPGSPIVTDAALPSQHTFINGQVKIEIPVNATLAPGRYELEVRIDLPPDDSSDDGISTSYTRVGLNREFGYGIMSGTVTSSVVYSNAIPTPGIDSQNTVRKINLPGDMHGLGAGLCCVTQDVIEGWNTPTYVGTGNPVPGVPWPRWVYFENGISFAPEKISSQFGVSTTVPGFWSAYCNEVSNLNVVQPQNMPWNLSRTSGLRPNYASQANPMLLGDKAWSNPPKLDQPSNSYDQTLPVESQVEPPSWIASRYFSLGFNIMDSNGNLEIVTTAGITGASAPAWPTTENGDVTDGTVHWNCRRVLAATAAWSTGAKTLGSAIKDSNGNTQVVTTAGMSAATVPTWATMDGQKTDDGSVIWEKRSSFSPVQHRAQAVPVYPFYWQGNNTLPTTWVAATAYALNATVIDANGNTQQCTTAGTSAATAPVWSLTLAGVTSDGATLKWTLITLAAETAAFLKPPTATSGLTRWGANDQWQRNTYNSPFYDAGWQADNLALGWWIYSVSINRMMLNPASQVAVTIGCIRNGSFVAFGTWNTGQTIQVLWPVFTSDALVYQCGERVDIQAVAIASGGAGVSTGATASGYPICAAFVSDTTALLNLL